MLFLIPSPIISLNSGLCRNISRNVPYSSVREGCNFSPFTKVGLNLSSVNTYIQKSLLNTNFYALVKKVQLYIQYNATDRNVI